MFYCNNKYVLCSHLKVAHINCSDDYDTALIKLVDVSYYTAEQLLSS